jgi:predicted metal-dependent HD superfamily phosphohydrolase
MTGPPDAILPGDILAALRARYDEPWRAYHGWPHVAAMLARAARLAPAEPEAFRLAILFHDAVYDPRARDNERQSAALMRRMLGGGVGEARLAWAEALILATESHRIPPGAGAALAGDAALFLDIDLAILAAGPADFARYDAAIRAEYAHVPEPACRAGRRAVLQGFLARDRLFFSTALGEGAEAAARRNLRAAIATLEQ